MLDDIKSCFSEFTVKCFEKYINQYLLFDYLIEHKLIPENLIKYRNDIRWNKYWISFLMPSYKFEDSLILYLYFPNRLIINDITIGNKIQRLLVKITSFDLTKMTL